MKSILIYSLANFIVAGLLFVAGENVCNGKTDLIHEYHQRNIRDKEAYGRAFGRALFVMSAGPLASALLALVGWEKVSITALISGLAIGFAMLIAVQIKYNGGIF